MRRNNLAEVLTNVAATLRERERLRRQVQVLSAEGRLSAVIIALIPILFAVSFFSFGFIRPLPKNKKFNQIMRLCKRSIK